VFENRVLRGIFGPKREEWCEAGENCTLKSFITYTSQNIIRVTKSMRTRWAGHVAQM
jgi:hypothetical protein